MLRHRETITAEAVTLRKKLHFFHKRLKKQEKELRFIILVEKHDSAVHENLFA